MASLRVPEEYGPDSMRPRYLFIRILEACNADCFMCDFARSKDRYRFTPEDFAALSTDAISQGIKFVRLTGGEPLLHRDIMKLVSIGNAAGLRMSIITNGTTLAAKAEQLKAHGLEQIVVSIDGAGPHSHDVFRNTPNLFAACIEGLEASRAAGLKLRVNTVVGPHNYNEMPALQSALEAVGVEQWELSAIKLDRRVRYEDPDDVLTTCAPLYDGSRAGRLVPMGKRFYGETEAAQRLYFEEGTTPRPELSECRLVGDVIYLDPKVQRNFGCSLLPHRSEQQNRQGSPALSAGQWILNSEAFADHVAYFRANGPQQCQGCSSTAAGYSDDVSRGRATQDWAF